jgi:hypothetical protein
VLGARQTHAHATQYGTRKPRRRFSLTQGPETARRLLG